MDGARILVWIASVLAVATRHVICQSDDVSELREIEDFLAKCESQMVLNKDYKDVVLVLGNTGAGKSTFTQWVAGDDSLLISTEFVKRSGEYVIIDNNKIGNSTIQSKTTFPDLVVDKDTNTAYYDISGFSDTRGIKNDIATSYFIKRIIDHVKNIKILLVVSHSSVRKGVDRLDLIRLLRHFTDLIKNIDRYYDAIGMVVTKVDNSYILESDGTPSLVSDDAIKSSIAAYLQDVAGDLEENSESETATSEVKKFANKTVNLIDALLFSDSEMYGRIALFRRPNRPGPVNTIPLLKQAKLHAKQMVTQNLQFIPTQTDDFSYTVSEDTKNKLHDLLKALEKSLEDNVKSVANNIFNHYNQLLDKIQHKIQHEVDIHDTDMIEFDLMIINNLTVLVDEAIFEVLTLKTSLDNMEHSQNIPNLIDKTLSNLNINIMSQSIISDISSIANFLDFIETSSIMKFKFNSNPVKQAIHELGRKMELASITVKKNHKQLLIDVENNVKSIIRASVTELKDKLANQEKDVHDIKELSAKISNFCNELIKVQNDSDSEAKLKDLKLGSYQIILTNYTLHKIEEDKYYQYFKNEIDILRAYLCDSQKWYEFLDILYNKLSSYEIQKDKGTKKHCNAFVYGAEKYEGRKVEDTNIDLILRDCYNDLYNAEYNKIKNINLTQLKVKLLQDIAKLTLNNDAFSQNCNGSKLTIRDRFVRLSAININICSSLTSLEILGMEKVFIDTDLDFTGENIQMTVMAPTWEIIGERDIVLNGAPGKMTRPRKAANDEDGRPGNPGGNGGDFLGFGDTFIDGENLSIFANGGDASSGQDGGDGTSGTDARSYTHYEEQTCFYLIVYCTDHTARQRDCTNGRDGRLGGQGGKGGDAGIVNIYSDAPFKVSAVDGEDGKAGSVGTAGRAGSAANIKTVSKTKLWLLFGSVTLAENVDNKYIRCSSGNTPETDMFSYMEKPTVPPKSEYISPTVFNEFKTYLSQNLEKTLRKNVLIKSMFWANQTLNKYFELDVVDQIPTLVEHQN